MKNFQQIIIVIFCFLFFSGCKSTEQQLIGTWTDSADGIKIEFAKEKEFGEGFYHTFRITENGNTYSYAWCVARFDGIDYIRLVFPGVTNQFMGIAGFSTRYEIVSLSGNTLTVKTNVQGSQNIISSTVSSLMHSNSPFLTSASQITFTKNG